MAGSLANLSMNKSWTTSTAGKLAQKEFFGQRMHREPIHVFPPAHDGPPRFESTHSASFPRSTEAPVPSHIGAKYTLGLKNELGTQVKYRQVDLSERQRGQVHLGADGGARSWVSDFAASFSKPDLTHPTQGLGAPRQGKAPRMPYSELERNFGSLTSEGTLPGKDGKAEGTSEHRHAYPHPGRQPLPKPYLTLGYGNDIGSSVSYKTTPSKNADATHYSLGEVPMRYVSETMEATAKPTPYHERSKREPAGGLAPSGPSEVEQGFRQQFNSQHYNIITGGERLHGALNSDAALARANANAHQRPVGRKQHPNVNPADRGPSGVRQSFDIISGIERPRERW